MAGSRDATLRWHMNMPLPHWNELNSIVSWILAASYPIRQAAEYSLARPRTIHMLDTALSKTSLQDHVNPPNHARRPLPLPTTSVLEAGTTAPVVDVRRYHGEMLHSARWTRRKASHAAHLRILPGWLLARGGSRSGNVAIPAISRSRPSGALA